MSPGMWFWLLMAVWFFFGGYVSYTASPEWKVRIYGIGGNIIPWICLAIVGWHAFGGPVK